MDLISDESRSWRRCATFLNTGRGHDSHAGFDEVRDDRLHARNASRSPRLGLVHDGGDGGEPRGSLHCERDVG
jgi:hypothetical protein